MKAKSIYTFVLLLFFGKIFSQDVIWKNIFYSDMSPTYGQFQPYTPFLLKQDGHLNTYLGATLRGIGGPSSLDLKPDLSSTAYVSCYQGHEAYISKYSYDGSYLWHKSFTFPPVLLYNGTDGSDPICRALIDNEGNTYMAGRFAGSVDFDPNPSVQNILTTVFYPSLSLYASDFFILKLDSNGNLKWLKQISSSTYNYIVNYSFNEIKLDKEGNIHLIGQISGICNLTPTIAIGRANSNSAIHLILDKGGNYISSKSMENISFASIVFSERGDILLSGSFVRTIDFDFGIGTHNVSTVDSNKAESYLLVLDSLYNYKNVTVIRATKPNIYNNSLRNLGLDSDSKKYLSSRDLFYQDSIYVRSGSTNEILIVTPLNQSKTIVIDSAGKYSQTLLIDGTTLITGNATKNFTSVLDTTLIFSEYYSQDSMGSVYRISGEQFRGNDGGAYGLDNHAQVLTKIGRRCDFIELDNNISSINDTLTTNSGGVYQWVNCANNFAPIVGETNQHFEPTTSGNYAVVMYKSGCKDTSECVNFNTLGFNKSYENSEFQFYPNPTTGWLYIETENYTTITIQDLNGKILQTQDVDKQGQIDISSFSSGMYLLRTKEGLTRKFIKE